MVSKKTCTILSLLMALFGWVIGLISLAILSAPNTVIFRSACIENISGLPEVIFAGDLDRTRSVILYEKGKKQFIAYGNRYNKMKHKIVVNSFDLASGETTYELHDHSMLRIPTGYFKRKDDITLAKDGKIFSPIFSTRKTGDRNFLHLGCKQNQKA